MATSTSARHAEGCCETVTLSSSSTKITAVLQTSCKDCSPLPEPPCVRGTAQSALLKPAASLAQLFTYTLTGYGAYTGKVTIL